MAVEAFKTKLKKMAIRELKQKLNTFAAFNIKVTEEDLITNQHYRKFYKNYLEQHIGHVGVVTTAAKELLKELEDK